MLSILKLNVNKNALFKIFYEYKNTDRMQIFFWEHWGKFKKYRRFLGNTGKKEKIYNLMTI